MANAVNLRSKMGSDLMSDMIADKWHQWEQERSRWMNQKKELRDYIFAIDTRTTTADDSTSWKNSTHLPKLCQIRDNLHANYMAAIFPHDRSIKWEPQDQASASAEKAKVIRSYMASKIRESDFRTDMSRSLLDFIDYGNSFGMVEYVENVTEDPVTGQKISGYMGPKFERISPNDIVFDPTASSFLHTPKIVRRFTTLASLKSWMESHPENEHLGEVFDKVMENRRQFRGVNRSDYDVDSAYRIDGFGSYFDYLDSDTVELLDFYGDIYDEETDTLYKNYRVTIVDRTYVLRKEANPSWLGYPPIFHVGWRLRPDNLYAMGPLDNLVGMQHRIDHLENAKADGYDLIIHPVMKIRGLVEDFDYGPEARIYVGDEGDIDFIRPDGTILTVDNQIALYEQKMEEMAGAPKQAMGFRTPGEKTAFEVQILENGANKVFLNKASYFEEMFMEPILNAMLVEGRRLMGASDLIRTVGDNFDVVTFRQITKEDLTAKGSVRPIGARHFARNANMLQNLVQIYNSSAMQDPSIKNHFSGKKMARLIEELLDLEKFDLVGDNVAITEAQESERLLNSAQQQVMEENFGSSPIQEAVAPQSGQSPVAQGPQNRG